MTYADEESSDRVEAISEALTKRAAALTAATDRAAKQAQQLRDGCRGTDR